MNAVDFLAAAGELPLASLADITGGGGLVVVAPHPDDESLGCGGLIAAARASGVAVRLVVLSDGVGSHPGSRRYPPARLRDLREAETVAAAAELGLAPDCITFLRLPDRYVPIEGEEAEAAVEAIRAAAASCKAGVVCVTWGFDPHCDHVAAAQLAQVATESGPRLMFYPVWGFVLGKDTEVGGPPRGVRFAVGSHIAAKQAAIAAHRSQTTNLIDDDPDGFRLTPEMLANFAGPYEILLQAARQA
jgi:LmbE family N-acetylglucosaminyl deacetylase